MKKLTIGTIDESELLELAKIIKLKSKLIAERKTITNNIKEKGRASCFISFFAHGLSRDLCDEQGDDSIGQLLQKASNKESEFILDKIYDSAISDLEIAISEYTVKQALAASETKELTGSDLARAMLARGDKYVLCFVSDFSDDYAANQAERINLVTHTEGNSICAKSARWKYAVPINQQTGEPLTAADVGL